MTPRWMTVTLRLAAIYNIGWGVWVVSLPQQSLRLCGYAEPIPYPQLWQCIGMIVGVYGVGYWIAAANPVRHWPIVLVGLLGKIFGPVGFSLHFLEGTLPLSAGRMCLLNDLVWWVPFTLILRHAWRVEREQRTAAQLSFDAAVQTIRSETGQTVAELSADRPLLLVFLRHAGCTFCREALSDVARSRAQIESAGTTIAFVHMSSPERAGQVFAAYGLASLPRFSDPDQHLYRAFGLKNGTFTQLMGPTVLWKGFQAALLRRHGFGFLEGNGLRLPGVFLVRNGQIVAARRLHNAAERPDYTAMAGPGACDAGSMSP